MKYGTLPQYLKEMFMSVFNDVRVDYEQNYNDGTVYLQGFTYNNQGGFIKSDFSIIYPFNALTGFNVGFLFDSVRDGINQGKLKGISFKGSETEGVYNDRIFRMLELSFTGELPKIGSYGTEPISSVKIINQETINKEA